MRMADHGAAWMNNSVRQLFVFGSDLSTEKNISSKAISRFFDRSNFCPYVHIFFAHVRLIFMNSIFTALLAIYFSNHNSSRPYIMTSCVSCVAFFIPERCNSSMH